VVFRLMIIIFVLNSWQARAHVYEIKFMHEITPQIDSNTLVVFDIDNTVIEPTGNLGSDQWYYFLVNKFQNRFNLSEYDAHRKAEPMWNMAQSYIKTQAVEEETSQIIARLQENNIYVMALTARSSHIAEITRQQLLENNIDFQKYAPDLDKTSLVFSKNLIYEKGILYQGEGYNKGKTLVSFLEHINFKPKNIVFIDDKVKNTAHVHKALEELGNIGHIEFRYANTDDKVKEFNKNFIY